MSFKLTAIKKKLLTSFLIIVAVTVYITVFFIGRNNYYAGGKDYEEEWNIDLPDNMKLEFKTSVTFIDGSSKYSVFTCTEPPYALFYGLKPRLMPDKSDFESKLKTVLDELQIPKKSLPSFDEKYDCEYLEGSHGIRAAYLYIVYYPSPKKMILCQDISQYRY